MGVAEAYECGSAVALAGRVDKGLTNYGNVREVVSGSSGPHSSGVAEPRELGRPLEAGNGPRSCELVRFTISGGANECGVAPKPYEHYTTVPSVSYDYMGEAE